MDTASIVGMLIAERDKLNRAIAALGGESSGGSAPAKRRGRPPKNPVAEVAAPIPAPAAPAKKKRAMSSEGRERQIAAMKQYWAAKKAAAKKSPKAKS
jgi:hypothetical protein